MPITVRKVLVVEGLANVVVMSIKLLVGIKTGSAAIIGDALHSLADVTNNVVAWLAVRVAEKPPDDDHPYGHQKFEQLMVFVLATLLSVVAFELAINAIQRFGEPIEQSYWGFMVMLLVLAINIALASWEGYWARRLDSDILNADARHTMGDVLTTVAVLIGWQLAVHGYPWMDSVFAIVVAGLVFYLAYDLFRRAIPILVDHAGSDLVLLANAIKDVPQVRAVRRVRSRTSGKEVIADIVITVDGQLSTQQSHSVADAIEAMLAEKFNINDAIIHIEPDRE